MSTIKSENTLDTLLSWSDKANDFTTRRNQILLSEFQKSPRNYTQKEAAEFCNINVRTLNKYANELGIDPTRHDDSQWNLTIQELYQVYDALPDKLKLIKPFNRKPGQKCQVISLNNQKGGCGKTLVSTTLASGIATEYRERFRVLLIDLDPQANASMFYAPAAAEQQQFTATDLMAGNYELDEDESFGDLVKSSCLPTTIPNLKILPASQHDRNFDDLNNVMNSGNKNPYALLKNIISEIEDDFDIIIIDTPPSTQLVTYNAYYAATSIIMPVTPNAIDLEATASYAAFMPNVYGIMKKYEHPGYDFMRVLLTNYAGTSASGSTNSRYLSEMFGSDKYQPGLLAAEGFKKCSESMCTVYDMSQSEFDGTRATFTKAKGIAQAVLTVVMDDIMAVWHQDLIEENK